uniref:Uncharacterized protein n=1 Tax=Knipowitschia caucasica TaxID=637954 RepID=A0AAV2L661_KNICA
MVTRVQMFSNESEFKNMETMVKLLGLPNSCDLDKGLRTREFFKRVGGGWALKTLEEFEDFPNFRSALTHLYFERCPSETELVPHDAIFLQYYMKNPKELTECLDLAESMLYLEESDRITAAEIMEHDFIMILMSKEKARKTFAVIQQKDR